MKVSSILTLAALLVVAGAQFAHADHHGDHNTDTSTEAPVDTNTTGTEVEGAGE